MPTSSSKKRKAVTLQLVCGDCVHWERIRNEQGRATDDVSQGICFGIPAVLWHPEHGAVTTRAQTEFNDRACALFSPKVH